MKWNIKAGSAGALAVGLLLYLLIAMVVRDPFWMNTIPKWPVAAAQMYVMCWIALEIMAFVVCAILAGIE